MRIRRSSSAFAILGTISCLAIQSSGVVLKPNFIRVTADGQNWAQTGYMDHPLLKGNPHMDEMARAGNRFDLFFAEAPVCSLTRVSVLTGRTPPRTGVPGLHKRLCFQEKTLSQALKDPAWASDCDGFVPCMEPGGSAVFNWDWRYIQYPNESEELYDLRKDPHEWGNLLAGNRGERSEIVQRMRRAAPRNLASPERRPGRQKELLIERRNFRWSMKPLPGAIHSTSRQTLAANSAEPFNQAASPKGATAVFPGPASS